MAKPRRTRKKTARRAPADPRRVTAELDEALAVLVAQRIDAIRRRYEAAWGEGRARIERAFAAAQKRAARARRAPLPKAKLVRVSRAWRAELELLFLKGVEVEVEAAAALRATVTGAVARVEERMASAEREAGARITGAFMRFHAESRLGAAGDEARVARWLARLGPPEPRSLAERRALLGAAEEAVAGIRSDELAFAADAGQARALVVAWREGVERARRVGAGGEGLMAEAEKWAEHSERIAVELESYLAEQTAARESFDRRLAEIRAALGEAEPPSRSPP